MSDGALIAVDPHKAHNTLVVLDPATPMPVEEAEFANSAAGYLELMCFARQWRSRRWAVEGCHGTGRSLAQQLVASSEPVAGCPRSWPRGSGCSPVAMAARPIATTLSRSAWPPWRQPGYCR